MPKPKNEKFMQLEKLSAQGKSQREIAELLGMSRDSVAQYMKRNGIKTETRSRKIPECGYSITIDRSNNAFRAWIWIDGKRHHLGYFKDELEAKTAAIIAKLNHIRNK